MNTVPRTATENTIDLLRATMLVVQAKSSRITVQQSAHLYERANRLILRVVPGRISITRRYIERVAREANTGINDGDGPALVGDVMRSLRAGYTPARFVREFSIDF